MSEDLVLSNYHASQSLLTSDEIDTLLKQPAWVEKREFDLLDFARTDVLMAIHDVSPLPMADAILAIIKVMERRIPQSEALTNQAAPS